MFHYIKVSDQRLFLLLNNHFQNKMVFLIMQFFTQLGSLVFAAGIPIILYTSGKGRFEDTALLMICCLLVSQVFVHTIKRLVNRPRPFMVIEKAISKIRPTCKYSFPSGHTCAAFSMAIVLERALPGTAIMFLPVASMVGISRVYLGAHYPSDVIVGAGIAYIAQIVTCIYI
ncbi:MAG: phosphatase PAP2 family protein [Syntrophomonadaceae bacterium]|nr:phosphatase PAP2 family protein [Syntrophomonadaceae bacterium]MDD4549927.1 phosphatase PAP2 family protein [Syntrophomonadaceae bacterium]